MKFERPIAIFAFRRPDHLSKVLEVVKKINPKKVYFYVDIPKSSASRETFDDWRSVLSMIESIDWIDEKHIDCATENMGCGNRISSGISDILSKEDSAIILEDDCVPDITFFEYCDVLLNIYKDNENVMMISGCNLLTDTKSIENDYFFSKFGGIWGWATWSRAWENNKKVQEIDVTTIKYLTFKEKLFYRQRLQRVKAKKLDTWDYQWDCSRFLLNGLSIVPGKSLVRNIGLGEGATNTTSFSQGLSNDANSIDVSRIIKKEIQEDALYSKEYSKKLLTLNLKEIVSYFLS